MTQSMTHLDQPVTAVARRDSVSLRQDFTVQEALDRIRQRDIGEGIIYFYVVDAQDRLAGVVPTRRLLTAGLPQRLSDIMIHQVSGGAQGQASDVERQVEYMFKLKKRLIKIISQHTGKTEDQVRLDSDRDCYMTAAEAKEYGLVDEVIKSRKEAKLLDGATPEGSTAIAEAALPRKIEE